MSVQACSRPLAPKAPASPAQFVKLWSGRRARASGRQGEILHELAGNAWKRSVRYALIAQARAIADFRDFAAHCELKLA
jgi:hypothetical protein